MNTEKTYKKMIVKELKKLCKEKGLKISGTKAQLINRLMNPVKSDLPNRKTTKYTTISVGWGDERSPAIGQLVNKGFAESLCYANDKFYYKVVSEKWVELLQKGKK
jgi:hypothetical protein